MTTKDFFDEQSEQSEVKSRIVAKYFKAWARIMIKQARHYNISNIAYAELFSGPGRYKDGNATTPLLVLESAINNKDMCEMLVTIFNDKNHEYTQKLQHEINSMPGINNLKNSPIVINMEFGEKILAKLSKNQITSYPTFYFIDPFGYKGLSLSLIASFLRGWGCECLLFFNYNRINMDFQKSENFAEYMNSIFGIERANQLRQKIQNMSGEERELTIIDAICDAFKEIGGSFVQKFLFKKKNSIRTSHYLIFVTKHPKGVSIMKDIMAKESSVSYQGVPNYEYSPGSDPIQLSLFDSRPLDHLEYLLLEEFAGQTLTRKQIYDKHYINHNYSPKNYKDILLKMEAEGKIQTTYTGKRKRQEGTFSETNILVTFPPK